VFHDSGLIDGFGLAKGVNFNNGFYRKVVARIEPSILFASADWDKDIIEEYSFRANSVNAKLVILPKITDYSTTSMEKFIF